MRLTCSIVMELAKELDKFLFVFKQDILDRLGFVGVCHKHLQEGEPLSFQIN